MITRYITEELVRSAARGSPMCIPAVEPPSGLDPGSLNGDFILSYPNPVSDSPTPGGSMSPSPGTYKVKSLALASKDKGVDTSGCRGVCEDMRLRAGLRVDHEGNHDLEQVIRHILQRGKPDAE